MLIRPARDEELQTSLRILLARERQSAGQLQSLVEKFLQYGRDQGLCFDLHWVYEVDHRLVASCLGVGSGGRTALLMVPPVRLFGRWRGAIIELVKTALGDAPAHNLRLLQVLLEPDETEDHAVLLEAGFRHLADLLYLERTVSPNTAQVNLPSQIEWVPYTPGTHALFAQAIDNTYVDSLDCAGLTGLRDIEDIVETHKASGIFTPETWWVTRIDSEPAGVLLLSRVAHQSALEVVYMGVLPAWRGQGHGSTLLDKADQVARAGNLRVITLAVDEVNTPAVALYERHGFRKTGKRRAFIGVPDVA